MFKQCSKCKRTLPMCFGHFYRQKATSSGYTSWCRDCDREKCRNYARKKAIAGEKREYNPEKSKEYSRRHRANNIEKCRERDRKYGKLRRECPIYRSVSSMSRRIREALVNGHGSFRHVSYSKEDLRRHLERQFTKGMSWDNYGTYWHIDHIVPVSSFNITGPECDEFKACWALTNLRPLKAEENLSKGDRITHLI